MGYDLVAVLEGAVIVVVNGDEYWMVVVVIMNKKHGCGRVAVGDGGSGDRVGGTDGAMAVLQCWGSAIGKVVVVVALSA
ncbi:hypothetical protein L1049_011376 [Liquidambar formosana]|uniref:Uncharacterized protein n=1 Tax=Liquidambar formosana TaxID=63359 RepID=A0AAP0RXW8_LIQFO